MNMLWTIEEGAGSRHLVLVSGMITEKAEFPAPTALSENGALIFDLSGVEQINSCGVREWLNFVTRLTDEARTFELVRCSPAIVRQLNMVADFVAGGRVRSVMLPYYCQACGHEERRVLELEGSGHICDDIPCPNCGEIAEFDDLPASYMAFAPNWAREEAGHDR